MQNNDHDLLIRLDENVRGITAEIKLLRDGTFDRINILEKGKLEIQSFTDFKVENDKAIKALFGITDGLAKKQDKQAYFIYIGIGIVITLQFIGVLVASAKW